MCTKLSPTSDFRSKMQHALRLGWLSAGQAQVVQHKVALVDILRLHMTGPHDKFNLSLSPATHLDLRDSSAPLGYTPVTAGAVGQNYSDIVSTSCLPVSSRKRYCTLLRTSRATKRPNGNSNL